MDKQRGEERPAGSCISSFGMEKMGQGFGELTPWYEKRHWDLGYSESYQEGGRDGIYYNVTKDTETVSKA